MSEGEDLKAYTLDEVSQHNTVEDLWVVYNGGVYDITKYIDEHPGGEEVVIDVAGMDATEAFEDIGHSDDAREILKGLLIGKVEGGNIKSPVSTATQPESTGSSMPMLAIFVLLIAAGVYFYIK
ncbi:DEHA2A05742p [Debaryomyces hansenii CBS767]|jgi:cytochrome b involved in lipid metabolism|uniref:DEHA2A05742p n=1 Tax=Debaryomyces hansenii (strain ATCC 36239 / CBS 767 / BCRC 21394 / JCM 1990 / NBRC 0083 / IGC 2968) TaxID=284592 RepID=Q6BYZ7_DEBHA|nr:DEHA2A05742p [Debaryomyces hansenii CBS767]CAG84528.1 DEHA2A05742p [Debaryomyces hansenii CBS767]|eukprot:XP_456572.1 DEHA2A05742p [Debaryomyces hansenii CBS767]